MKRKYIHVFVITVLTITTIALCTLCRGKREKYEGMQVQQTPLQQFVSLSKDSTYLIFIFMPSCRYCQNSVKSLNEYKKIGVVDKVIGLTLKDSVGENYFVQNYKPTFRIIGCDALKLLEFNNRFPTSYLIENNVIVRVFRGELLGGKKFFKKSKSKQK